MPQKIELTEFGKQDVENYIERCEQQQHKEAAQKANDAFKQLMKARRIRDCDHEVEYLGGIERVETRCTKCGFSWFD